MSEMDGGYVVMYRRVFKHPLFRGKLEDVAAWFWLISEASWRDRKVLRSGRYIELKRGQLAHSIGFIAREWKWSNKKVRCFLKRWCNDGAILIEPEKGIINGRMKGRILNVITICNYDVYQATADTRGTIEGIVESEKGLQPKKETKERAAAAAAGGSEILKTSFEAVELSDQIYTIFGVDPAEPKGWSTLPEWVDTGLKSGWSPNIVRLACRRVASRHKPGKKLPESHRYLAGAIQDEHDNAAVPPPFTPPNPQEIGNGQAIQQREFNLLRKIDGKGGNVGGRGGGFVAVALEAAQRVAAANRSGR